MRLNPQYDDVSIPDRIISASSYLLPVLDGINYGRFLFFYFPQVAAPILTVLSPILAVYKSSPFVSFGVYLGLVCAVVVAVALAVVSGKSVCYVFSSQSACSSGKDIQYTYYFFMPIHPYLSTFPFVADSGIYCSQLAAIKICTF